MKRISTDLHLNEKKSRKPAKQGEQDMGSDLPDDSGKPGQVSSREIEDEIGGPSGLEPTRFGDWEVNGRCSDF